MYEDIARHIGKFYGKYGAVVVDNLDKDFLGRIKVSVPSVLGADTVVSARPCFPYGHFFVPPIGEMVWVEFEAGDVRYPLWVGSWPVKGKSPAEAQLSPPDNRVIQTPSGHTIEIMDKDGEEKIVIRHKGNSFITIDKNGSVLIGNQKGSMLLFDSEHENAVLVEQHGNVITMDDKGVVITQKSAKAMVQITDDTVHVAAQNIVLSGAAVSCGKGATEPTILGQTFMTMWNAFIFHTHATAMGPSGPPLPPTQPLAPGNGLSSAVTVK